MNMASAPADSFDARALAVDAISRDPAVDTASVVPDLKPVSLFGLHQMQVLPSIHFAQYDVAHFQCGRINSFHRAKLARLDLASHRVSPRPKLYRFTLLQSRNVLGCPSHGFLLISLKKAKPTT